MATTASQLPAIATRPERNLVLVHQPHSQDLRDFEAIADIVRAKAPDIDVIIAWNSIASSVTKRKAARLPSLIFSPLYLRYFVPARGKVYAGLLISKREQMERFLRAGLSVPPYWFNGSASDPLQAGLGSHVLVKSAMIGASNGDGFKLMPTGAALKAAPSLGDVFLQRFIDTGPYPVSYRVLSIFGCPVSADMKKLAIARPSLDAPDEELANSIFRGYFSAGLTMTLCYEDDVLALAGAAYKAIPEVPFQACDIIREDKTGVLYVLEVNPGGNTWVFSNASTDWMTQALGAYDIKQQFNAFETIADALIEKTRSEAE